MELRIAKFGIERERDVSLTAQRARLLASLAGLPSQRRTAFGRALTEIARNAVNHAGGGIVEFRVRAKGDRQWLEVIVRDRGPGIPDLQHVVAELASVPGRGKPVSGLRRAQGWVDHLTLDAQPEGGTVVRISQALPPGSPPLTEGAAADWAAVLANKSPRSALVSSQRRILELDTELSVARRQGADLQRELEDLKSLNDTMSLLALVASKTDHAVVILDQLGNVEWVNDAFVRITGYELREVVGKPPAEFLHGAKTDEESLQEIDNALRNQHSLNQEILQYRKDGRTYWASTSLTPVLDDSGLLTRWIAIFSDATRRRQAQESLEAAKEAAEAASRTKSEFLANMSHEIRTPMNAIIGMTELALGTELTAEQREYLLTVKQSSDALLRLLNDVLDLSKIEAGKLQIEWVPFRLPELLHETMKALSVRAAKKGLETAWRFPPDGPEQLVGDPIRLRQILFNLVGNAIKFTKKGEVVVTVDPQWQTETEVALHFAVADTGIGIPADRLQQIFEAFTQVDSSTSRRFGGTGLGLTISSQLIDLMGGRIWVQSKVGKGSTFHFSLRFGLPETQEPPDEPPSRGHLAGKSVLVVDDNATNRRILKECLQNWGMQPTAALNGRSALAELQRAAAEGRPFSLVLLDAAMPKMDGFELARQIQSGTKAPLPTVMMLSSSDRPGDIARCKELGMAAYLVKPIASSDLRDAVERALGRQVSSPEPPSEAGCAAPPRALRILVADDNKANRVLAARILEKRGHHVVSVPGGREALDLVEREPFDVVLLDVQMPKIDGFAATAAIRGKEKESGGHLPIIAMTAYAMSGDRQRCLDAGMDGYIAKPLHARELHKLVEGIGDSLSTPAEAAVGSPAHVALDFGPALARLEGDVELLREQMRFFLQDAPGLLADLGAAIARCDGTALNLAAHRLKGLVGNFDARAAMRAAQRLETKGHDEDFSEAGAVYQDLECELARLRRALEAFLEKG